MHPRYSGDRLALGRFEVFLTSAVATVIVVRALLIATGYPKIGGGGLHIAHVLWGGLLMGVAIVIVQLKVGSRMRHRAAVIGGVGFGLFIDEVGKFLTKSVNYFFRPAIAIIYIVFVLFYLVVREVVLHQHLTERQRLGIAASALTDRALGQLTESNRSYAIDLVTGITSEPTLAEAIKTGLAHSTVAPEDAVTRARNAAAALARRAVGHERFTHGLAALVVVQALVLLGELAVLLAHPGVRPERVTALRLAEVATAGSAALTLYGAYLLHRRKRAAALRALFRSVLVTLLVTQIFVFTWYQAGGIVGLVVDLLLLGMLRLADEAQPGMFHAPTVAA